MPGPGAGKAALAGLDFRASDDITGSGALSLAATSQGSISNVIVSNAVGAAKVTTDDQTKAGIGGQKGTRKAPSFLNQAWTLYPYFFWDGRAASLEEQALGPIANPTEMGNTHEAIVNGFSIW